MPKLPIIADLATLLHELAMDYNFDPYHTTCRFESDCFIVEGIDKTHELVIYSDLTHELKSI